jgi:ribosomal protein L35AE/L33A
MIEVFKTNINCPEKAKQLVDAIHCAFVSYKANFDLEDCDKVLRIVSSNGIVTATFIHWLKSQDCHAEILPDN